MRHRLGVGRWKWLVVGSWALGVVLCATLAHAQVSNWPSESAPRPLAPKEFKFPPYEIRTLSNGMQVMVILHHEQPAVTMRLLTRAGAAQDPQNKRGVAELVAHLLDQGTTTRSRAADRRTDRFHRRCARHRVGHRPDLRQRRGDEGLVRLRDGSGRRHRPESGVLA